MAAFIDHETEEYEQRRRERAMRRALHEQEQREREKKLRKYIIITVTSVAVTLIVAILIIVGISVARENREAMGTRTTEVDAEAELAEGGDPMGSLYEEEVKVPIPEDAPEPVMITLSEDALPDGAVGEWLGLGPQELNTTTDDDTDSVSAAVDSGYAILISLSDNKVLAARQPHTLMYPASMTKVMTVLVAAEHLESEDYLNDVFTITQAIEGFSYDNGCSNVGFSVDEKVTVEDLFYGTILPSGADAAMGLAEYIAGDQETFVAMMNEKAEELGLSGSTHFANCIGIYDDENYTTPADMAVIMNAAINNPLCFKVLSAHTYTTTHTYYHPEGITVSNWFLRRIEDKQDTGVVYCGKTGFVNESLNCAVSYAVDEEGKGYICCTGYGHGGWKVIYDHVALYSKYFDPSGYQEVSADEVPEGENPEGDAAN